MPDHPAKAPALRRALLWALLILVLLSLPSSLVVPSGSGRLLDFLPDAIANAIRLLADKVVHVGLFAVQAVYLRRASVPPVRAATWTSLYGAATELYQAALPFRSGDVYDFAADVLGALLGVWWCHLRSRQLR